MKRIVLVWFGIFLCDQFAGTGEKQPYTTMAKPAGGQHGRDIRWLLECVTEFQIDHSMTDF